MIICNFNLTRTIRCPFETNSILIIYDCSHIVLELSKSRVQNWTALWLRDEFEFGDDLPLGEVWDDSWDNEEEWQQWLQKQASDPFEELPKTWLED